MTSHVTAPLHDHDLQPFGAIRVAGADRNSFLQGQLSNDLRLLSPEKPLLAGWANPQGRLICTVWAVDWQEATWLLLPEELIDLVLKRLRMFVLRSNVQLERADGRVEPVSLDANQRKVIIENANLNSCFYDENTATLGIRNIDTTGVRLATTLAGEPDGPHYIDLHTDLQLQLIRAGIPIICNSTSGEFVPQMVNLDLLGGISFTKGCYVGQEIVARTQNLGRIKRRMFAYSVQTTHQVKPGDAVYADGDTAGQVVNCARSAADKVELLAVIRLDHLAAPLRLEADGQEVLHPLPLPYPVPEVADR